MNKNISNGNGKEPEWKKQEEIKKELSDFLAKFLVNFLVCTACIGMVMGVLGCIFLPEEQIGYGAFFSPPVFGFFSMLFGVFLKPGKKTGQVGIILKMLLHLVLIEALVFGLNYLSGHRFELPVQIALACSVAVIYAMVTIVIYINDRRSAMQFNEELRKFKERLGQSS